MSSYASYPSYRVPFFPARGEVRLVNGRAIAPPGAPAVVQRAVAAGNRLQNKPYKWGGGHARLDDWGYDCSGAVSYVLREAGLLQGQMPSSGFFNYGNRGEGDWITVWVREGHVYMTIGGLRLDTGGSTDRTGPRWKAKPRNSRGFLARHPRGW
ncbi:NlpC/P60 family protein [Roseibacillus ishigakijimensis]|uniref:C40 family peptidase n=1 Tax=Roseibacillus ishigakijimensis TaxID=454146 RepID=A0A934RLX6_9BACT|nr:NlpC/P60 family protein [Roseibacillus ishigakijimensis]MBK1833200.1 C40 family peptidase [Roseibacillus ishigakijimensis]